MLRSNDNSLGNVESMESVLKDKKVYCRKDLV